jgi:hypothetical protein
MESLSWQSHPAKERPATAVILTIFIMVVMVAIYYTMERSFLMMLFSGLVLTVSLSTFYFPTTYTVDEKNVKIRYMFSVKERNLSAFRQYFPEARGILLSPFLSASRLENFRGFYLRYGKDNKTEVDAFVSRLIDTQKSMLSEKTGPEESNAV